MATDKVKQYLEVSSEMIREQNERHLSDEEEDRFLSRVSLHQHQIFVMGLI